MDLAATKILLGVAIKSGEKCEEKGLNKIEGITKKMKKDYLLLIEEGYFYGDTLQKVAELVKEEKYSLPELRSALYSGLQREIAKYRRWKDSDPLWVGNENKAKAALDSLATGKSFSYKGVLIPTNHC